MQFIAPACRYVNEEKMPATDAYVGLAAPGDVGSWQTEKKVLWIDVKLLMNT